MTTKQKRKNRWMSKNAKPEMSGWFYVHNLDGSLSSRYYDDSGKGSWWNSTARDGWTQNNSFIDWLLIPEIHVG